MNKTKVLALSACIAAVQLAGAGESYAAESKNWRVVSEQTVSGFAFPE